MDSIRHIRNKLFFRRTLSFSCAALLFLVGGSLLWKYCLTEAYVVWEPVITYIKNISLGWLLLAVALWGAWKGLRYKFVEDSSCRTNMDKEILAISDAPIKTSAEDEFSRGAYVRMLSTLIMSSPNEREARYIGIYAPWGDGKTSVRFLLEERILSDYGEDGAIIVDFSPWQYPESADIRMLFFERLANAVAKAGCDDVSKMSSLVAKYFAMTRINRSVGPLHDVIDWLRKMFVFGVFSEESLTADFRELLSAMEKKVVVVVDDLDRLSKEETCRVIRFLKANGDLPNITYLILADRKSVV